nr:hypothetical protein [Tanacetum cinerariifolium]
VRNKRENDKIGSKPDQIKKKREAWKSPEVSKTNYSQESRKRPGLGVCAGEGGGRLVGVVGSGGMTGEVGRRGVVVWRENRLMNSGCSNREEDRVMFGVFTNLVPELARTFCLLGARLLLGKVEEGRGSGVEVVEWSRKWGRGGDGVGGKNGQSATVLSKRTWEMMVLLGFWEFDTVSPWSY